MRYAQVNEDTVVEVHDLSEVNRPLVIEREPITDPRHPDDIIPQDPIIIENQTEQDYIDNGWLPVTENAPGKNQKITGWTVSNDTVEPLIVDMTADEISAILKGHIIAMDSAARDFIDNWAHWSAGPMVFGKAEQGLPISGAIKTWVESVWVEFYTRKAKLEAGVDWDDSFLDFSVIGDCPYPIGAAMQE